MGFFKKKSSSRHSSDDGSFQASGGSRHKRRGLSRSPSGDTDDGFAYDSSPVQKEKRVKKMKMRMMRGKKSKSGSSRDDASMSSRTRGAASSVDDYSSVRRGTRSTASASQQYGYGDNGDFQLDMIPSGGVTRSMPSPQETKRFNSEESRKKFRVKPHHVFPAPHYLNEEGLYQSMMAPSEEHELLTSYLTPSTKNTRRMRVPEAVRKTFGTPKEDGRIGSLRVEVLGCVGLGRSKPDVSVYMVVGDCAFATDMISGFRSPMWPNASKRCAVFPLHHAYARLFVGVFDSRNKKTSEPDAFCGRIVLDVQPIRPNTEYDVTFPLRNSSFIYDRRPRGVIRLRFSLHWFSERSVIMSYLKRPRNELAFSKQAKKQPTIPCGDPKTFRNVAVTVHGVDFPGKYTRGAFRATMREFNLYQQNLRFLFKTTIMDCILYENPLMSLYLFVSCMYCVWQNSVRYVPPIFVGWIIYIFVENYLEYSKSTRGNLGYMPLSIFELLRGFVRDSKTKQRNFNPILVKKRARTREKSADVEMIGDIELINHREFPFSERFEYPKLAAADAIAPSPSKKKGRRVSTGQETRTARRLSIITAPVEQEKEESEGEESDEDSDPGEKEDDNMMDQGDDGYEGVDSDDEDDDDDDAKGGDITKNVKRRIRVGPPQNSDKSGKKQPPQVHLARVEHLMHRLSKNISVEMVFYPPPHLQQHWGSAVNMKAPPSDLMSAKEKQNFDEFDRMLGYRVKNPNPIIRITSSFLGPLMRIIRIFIYATRISFNLTTWRDPYLSFWVLMFLCTLCFILLIFPWRTFFLISTILLLGPQNIAVRKFLESRKREKEIEEKEKKAKEEAAQPSPGHPAYGSFPQNSSHNPSASKDDQSVSTDKKKKRGLFGRKIKEESTDEKDAGPNEAEFYQSPRPAFFAKGPAGTRRGVPRDVAVPYFRFRKDRFYDWPPDPTVSRATPMLDITGVQAPVMDELENSVHAAKDPRQTKSLPARKLKRANSKDDDDYFAFD